MEPIKKLRTVTAFASLLLAGCFAVAQTRASGNYPKDGPDENIQDVSRIQLIANPQPYDQKRVRITGFLDLQFEGDAIYLHNEDFDNGLNKNALGINVPRDITQSQIRLVNHHYVIYTGTFVASNHGHMGLFAGDVTGITRLELWGPSLRPPPKQK